MSETLTPRLDCAGGWLLRLPLRERETVVIDRTLAAVTLLLALLLLPDSAQSQQPAPRPNVVVILVDDLRWDELGCMGHPWIRTPGIDRIAREGARCRNAFCTTPLCSPVRACLLTGLDTHHHGILDNTNRSEASHRLVTFPMALQQAGYQTAYVGKWHMGNDPSPRPGFDTWVSMEGQGTSFDPVLNVNGKTVKETGHTTDALNKHALEFVKQRRDQPFCLYVAHKALHPELTQFDDGSISDPSAARFLPAKRHEGLYAEDAVPRRLNVTDDVSDKPALARRIADLPPLSRLTGTDDETIRDRARMLAAVDDGVSQLLDALAEQGTLDKTLFIFTSDHGYWYGEHGLSVERRLAYEEALRVPLLIRYPPMIAAGTLVDAMALSTDLAPTVLDLAGVKPLAAMDGRSLAPLLKGTVPDVWRTSFLVQYNTDTVFPRVKDMGYRAVRTQGWKYIRYLDLEGMDELYDLLNDPYEMTNVIGKPELKQQRAELAAELDRLLEATQQ